MSDDGDLMELLTELAGVKARFDKVSDALTNVYETGYGIVMPTMDLCRVSWNFRRASMGIRYSFAWRSSFTSSWKLRPKPPPAAGREASSWSPSASPPAALSGRRAAGS